MTRTEGIENNYELYKIHDTKEIAAIIRKHIRARFSMCKFSVTSDYHSINIDLLSSPFAKDSEEVKAIVHYFPWSKWWLKLGVLLGGKIVAPAVPFKKLFFMEDALKFREAMPDFPFTYVGGVVSRETADEAIEKGFPMIQMGRAVLEDTDFVNKMQADEKHCSGCTHSNFCIGRMYSKSMQCHKHCEDITPALRKEVERLDIQNDTIERKLGYK